MTEEQLNRYAQSLYPGCRYPTPEEVKDMNGRRGTILCTIEWRPTTASADADCIRGKG